MRLARLGFLLAVPFLLASCLLTPGRFTSTLDIRKDRGFTFTYAGEAILVEPTSEEEKKDPKPPTADEVAKRRGIAEALAREVGYRSAEYLGGNKYRIDYAIEGRLDRGFVFPFNGDAMAIIPWLAIEVRKDGTARVKASAFGKESTEATTMPSPTDNANAERQGSFTLTTDAELLMQNNEGGTAPGPETKVVWTVTPTSTTVPTAVVRFAN